MEADKFSDAAFQSMLASFHVEEPDLQCPGANRIARICTNPSCKTAFICGQPECQYCGFKVHPACPSVAFGGITNLLNQSVAKYKEIILKVMELDGQFTKAVEESKNVLVRDILDPKFRKIISQVYEHSNPLFLSGRAAKQFCQEIQRQNDALNKNQMTIIQRYNDSMQAMVQEIIRFKERVMDMLVDDKRGVHVYREEEFKQKEMGDKGKLNDLLKKKEKLQMKILEKHKDIKDLRGVQIEKKGPDPIELRKKIIDIGIDSVILNQDHLRKQHLQFLMMSLDYPISIRLLYRGSGNNLRSRNFHLLCDGVPNTLTVVKTEFNKIIGGFTKNPWKSQGGYCSDPFRKVFLLCFETRQKLVALDGSRLTYNNIDSGPRFGTGDLFIADECDKNNKSFAIIPNSFNTRDMKYKLGQKSYELFSGAKDGFNFRVLQYQVFQVTYENSQPIDQQSQPLSPCSRSKVPKKKKEGQYEKVAKKGSNVYNYDDSPPKKEKKDKKYDKDCSIQ